MLGPFGVAKFARLSIDPLPETTPQFLSHSSARSQSIFRGHRQFVAELVLNRGQMARFDSG